MKKRISKVLCFIFILSLFVSLFSGGTNVFSVKAAGTLVLNEKSKVTLESVIDKSNGDTVIYPWSESTKPEITYGDTLHVKLAWAFPDNFKFDTSDTFTYQLPTEVKFNNIPSTPIYNGANKVGTFSITDNVISINYTDAKFCSENKRHGSLTFSGSIVDDGKGNTPEKDIKISFPGAVTIEVHMKPSAIESDLDIAKRQDHLASNDPSIPASVSATDKEHVYKVRVIVKSKGNNTNVQFRDDMWPGMTLLTEPEFYSNENLSETLDSSKIINRDWAIGGDKIYFDVASMGNTDVVALTYLVQINAAMYSFDTANDFIKNNFPNHDYAKSGYPGKVSNRASVLSDELEKKGVKWYQKRSWGDVSTIYGSIDKWSNLNTSYLDAGVISWEIILKSIKGSDYTEGYVVDVLPANLELLDDTVIVRDLNPWGVIENAVTFEKKDIGGGKTEVTFKLSDKLINGLKSSESNKCIYYSTKVVRQEKETDTYENTATAYYNKNKIMDVTAKESYTKPKELQKFHEYTELTAPNVEYAIFVNPAELDLDSETDDLVLDDVMSSSFELIIDSVLIDDQKPAAGVFTYDTATRKMSFKLKDKKAYKITYEARVLLTHDDKTDTKELTESNSKNEADLYSTRQGGYKESVTHNFTSNVWQSAASSSSEADLATLEVIKHKEGDATSLLKDAVFKLEKYNVKETNGTYSLEAVTGSDGTEQKTTDENGSAVFGSLKRGMVYALVEEKAPAGYAKKDLIGLYAFEDPKVTLPAKISYKGTVYDINIKSATYDNETVYVSNSKEMGSLKFSKTVTGLENDVNADNITFNIYKIDANGNISNTPITDGTFTYGDIKASGYKQIDNLEPGKYRVVESNTDVEGYTLKNSDSERQVDIEVTASNTANSPAAGSITNTYEKNPDPTGSLKFTKTIVEQDADGKDVANSNTDSIVSKNLADAISFKLYKLDDNGDVTGDAITTFTYADIKTNGYKQVDDIIIGKYRIVESNTAIEGYTLETSDADQKVDVDVTANNTTSSPALLSITNTYKKKPEDIKVGSLKFIKTIAEQDENGTAISNSNSDSIISKNLANKIKFLLYKVGDDGNISGDVIATFTYGEIKTDGYKQIDDLEIGKYRVIESNTDIDGYEFKNSTSDIEVTVDVTENNTTTSPAEMSLTNTYQKKSVPKGNIKITKTISGPITQNDKENLTFTVSDGTNTVWSGKLGDKSKFTEKTDGAYESVLIENLDPNIEYSVTETLYDISGLTETVTYKIGTGEEKTGDKATGIKTSSGEITIVQFKDVYAEETTASTEATTEATTEASKVTSVTTEATTSASKKTTSTTEDTDDDDDDIDDEDDDDDKGDLIVTILDEKTKKPVPNAVVTIQNPDGSTGTYTTDENGQIILKKVPAGDYKITVTKVPDGYHVTTGKTETAIVKKNKETSHTSYVDKDDSTQTTTSAPNPAPGSSNNTPPRNTSVRTGDDAAGKIVVAMFFAVISIIYIISWMIYRIKKHKDEKQ